MILQSQQIAFNNTGGVVADALTVSVAGDFDYGTITANSYNLNVDGDFSYDDAANDFVLGLNDTLTVLGSANIVAADFANSGTIAVTGSLVLQQLVLIIVPLLGLVVSLM